ncbi:MAG: hypothetical protein M1825_002686 [Sarcosagium campestre]|nr:MAG: hypothetical protein M1825_002686 [Sarcosagium campestre]
MAVRPGQHVGADGMVYHPYLARWADFWDKSNILDFLSVLRDVFAKEPPVVSRQQSQRPPEPRQSIEAPPPPIPPLPPELGRNPSQSSHSPLPSIPQSAPPPPPPPKPREIPRQTSQASFPSRTYQNQDAIVPPLQNRPYQQPQRTSSLYQPQEQAQRFIPTAGPIPPLSQPVFSPHDPRIGAGPYQQSAPERHPQSQGPSQALQTPLPQSTHQIPSGSQPHPGQLPAPSTPAHPAVDLLSSPITLPTPVDLTASSSSIPAPPIPPNPEKDALLRALGTQLFRQRQQAAQQAQSTIPSLLAQQTALANASHAMQNEVRALEALDAMLTSNERILADSMRRADEVMEDARKRKVPGVDDVLVAPNLVGKQLYDVVAEERAVSDAIFVLAKALDRGRVGLDVFLKQTRGLAREQFLKKALIRKISRGMGLAEEVQHA